MDEFVAKENIKHFKKLLVTETDEAKRQAMLNLLAEEEAKLTKIIAARSKTAEAQ
jgi:hypothetical protein